MAQIGNIPEIIEVKNHLEKLKQEGFVDKWELPYENLLTRMSAAIFFLSAISDSKLPIIWEQLGKYNDFRYRENKEKKLSQLDYRIEFSDQG